jgi:hypothetical protein
MSFKMMWRYLWRESWLRQTSARELNIDVPQSLITITQVIDNGPYWRVNYGAKDYVGRRGGDLVVEVDANDASVKKVLRGQ